MKKLFPLLAIVLLMAGCSRTVQTTSGQEYLSRYESVPVMRGGVVTSADGKTVIEKSIDERVREAAAVEPILSFPARIGLARVDGGALTTIPASEVDGWEETRKKLGDGFGEFVPVSPLVARMAAESGNANRTSLIDTIRIGAARQHLDAVLIYEVISKENKHENILAAANSTIIGAYILPSERREAEGLGNGLLIDVMQGYPYGTITTTVSKKSRLSSHWGWGSESGDEADFAKRIKSQAALQLADEAYAMFTDLRSKLAEKTKSKK